ncbi:MAG: hypothetical protein PQJ50_12810 [Spirochaetales bacterium]|nr:hypothetical protein [Spirochaetales bacterium]
MLNKYEYVIKTCDYVEQSLVNRFPYIACYGSFHDKLNRLSGRVPSHIMNQLHMVRQQRNYLAHNEEFRFNWSSYDRALHSVHNWLGTPIIYVVSREAVPTTVVHSETRVVHQQKKNVDAKDVLIAASAGLAGIGLVSLLGNKKDPFR